MDFKRLDTFLDSVSQLGVPGCSCVITRDHEVIYRHMAGHSDLAGQAPVTGGETMYMYSCSKPVTCTAAMQLYERGEFLLNDPLSDYMPEFKDMNILGKHMSGFPSLTPAQRPITIGDLLGMSAGIGGLAYYLQCTPVIRELQQRTDGRVPTLELVRALATQPLQYEPGTRWAYGLGHDVLGGLIQVISGKPLDQYARENIFAPLGMEHSGYLLTPELKARMMPQYTRDSKTGEIVPTDVNEYVVGTAYESGGAGLISTTDDYSLFLEALANGGVGRNGCRILGSRTLRLMHTNRLNDLQRQDFERYFYKGYGYGLGLRTPLDYGSAGVPVCEDFGWNGAAGAAGYVLPEKKISLFYGQHVINNKERYIHYRLQNVAFACLQD